MDAYEATGAVQYLVKRREDFRDQSVVIAGGGDSAVDWALSLRDVAAKVYVVHRRPKFRAAPESAAQLDAAAGRGEVEMVIPYQLHALHGEGGTLREVEVATLSGGLRRLPADRLLPFFGLSMELGPIADWGLDLAHSHIHVTPATCETSLPGVFAIGDVATYPGKLKLILQGFSEAAMAAHAIHPIVHPDTALHFEYSTTSGVGCTRSDVARVPRHRFVDARADTHDYALTSSQRTTPMLSRRTAMLLGAALPLARLAPAAAQSVPPAGPFTLPPLPYAPSANEPHIDAQTMSLHHDKHHAGYVANLNAAVKDHPKLAAMPVQTLLAKLNEVPDAIRTTIRNNAGGHANHSMFWQVMGGKGGAPGGDLESAINQEFKSFDEFKTRFNRTGAGQFGSGWVFVTVDKAGQAGPAEPSQPGHAADGRPPRAVRQRRVGARLLPEIPEPPRRLPGGLVERGELGRGGQALCRRQGRHAGGVKRQPSVPNLKFVILTNHSFATAAIRPVDLQGNRLKAH